MLKRWIGGAALLLVMSAPRPASAQLFDPYLNLYQARTTLASPEDQRPKDALISQAPRKPDVKERFIVGPFTSRSNRPGPNSQYRFGIGLGYANAANERHPWQVAGSWATTHVNQPGADDDQPILGFEGKATLWQPTSKNAPVVTLVADIYGGYNQGTSWDLILAADQRITDRFYGTLNAGYSRFEGGGGVEALATGFGVTYLASRRLSLSTAYSLNNSVAGEDFWSLNALYAFDRTSSILFGGGKHESFYVQYLGKIDLR
jgi:hypothetical protein